MRQRGKAGRREAPEIRSADVGVWVDRAVARGGQLNQGICQGLES